jgi:predicted ABC-class ATPase
VKVLFESLPGCVERRLLYKSLDPASLSGVAALADDWAFVQRQLRPSGLAAFVANGSILPRASGVSTSPMARAVPFVSPRELEVSLELPHRGPVTGLGVKLGVTLIVGGGYHGKSTLLEALEVGVYPHIAGDGRELVVTDPTAFKLRAEDGRSVKKTDISMFIQNLPNGRDTKAFYSEDASGSTSQAANAIEAIESGATLFLIDEDTSASNFMVRDELMQRVVHRDKEPITPFIERVRGLYEKMGVSSIIVAGSSGAFFHVADCVIQMDCYLPHDVTGLAKQEAVAFPLVPSRAIPFETPDFSRCPRGSRGSDRGGRGPRARADGVSDVSVDHEQAVTLSHLLVIAETRAFDGRKTMREVVDGLCRDLAERGFEAVGLGYAPSDLAMPRRQEIFGCFNRYRQLKL